MIDKCVEFSPKSNNSKPLEDDKTEVRNLKLLYRNTTNSERDKSSGASSDEETTSSSLIPIPDTLRQMRCELKKTISDIGEPSEADSTYTTCGVVRESREKVRNSLHELRKKYTLKNETSVTLKMNSANLMLDNILKSSNLNKKISSDSIQSTFFRNQNFKEKAICETETSEGSVASMKPCSHIPLQSILPHSLPPIPFVLSSSPCPRHGNNVFQPICSCSTHLEKGQKSCEENLRKKSFVEKINDLQIKYKIQSIYRMMQRTNPFNKSRKESNGRSVDEGIPGANKENDAAITELDHCKCIGNKSSENQYPKRMIFDLVESSDTSQSDSKSTDRNEKHCTCSTGFRCTCSTQKQWPEVIPGCICTECTCKDSDLTSEHTLKEEEPLPSPFPVRTNEYVQTDARSLLEVPTSPKKDDVVDSAPVPQRGSDGNHKKKEMASFPKDYRGLKKHCSKETRTVERTDIYYFDHGNSAYYKTTDNHPVRYTECLVERTDEYATKFWAEIFGAIEVGIAFLITFILQFYRFLFTSIIRSLTVGLLQIFSDYFFKPLLTITFNGIIQPCLIFAYNIATSLRDLCLPISQIFGFFAKEVANILRSCRIIEVNQDHCKKPLCYCGNKV